jgi:hypothetical protein
MKIETFSQLETSRKIRANDPDFNAEKQYVVNILSND